MKIIKLERIDILDFEKEHNLTLTVRERPMPTLPNVPKWYVSFDDSDVEEGSCLAGIHGNGDTPDKAILDYCTLISNKRLRISSLSKEIKRLNVPILTYHTETETKVVCKISFSENQFQNITPKDKSDWSKAYPAVDIDGDILRAAEWLKSNPTKTKSNYRRFLTNWFARMQERGGDRSAAVASTAKKTKLFPIAGKKCSKCPLPAVYKAGGGAYDNFYCGQHMPETVKEKYEAMIVLWLS